MKCIKDIIEDYLIYYEKKRRKIRIIYKSAWAIYTRFSAMALPIDSSKLKIQKMLASYWPDLTYSNTCSVYFTFCNKLVSLQYCDL